MQSQFSFSFQFFCLSVTYENSFSICSFRYFLKSSSLYSTSVCCLEISNPFKMNQYILSTGCFNESRPSRFFRLRWEDLPFWRGLGACFTSQKYKQPSVGYRWVLCGYHGCSAFQIRGGKGFPWVTTEDSQGSRSELHAGAFEIEFSFGLENSKLFTLWIWPWKETSHFLCFFCI